MHLTTWPDGHSPKHFKQPLQVLSEHPKSTFELWHGDLHSTQLIRQWKGTAMHVLVDELGGQ